MQKLTFPITFVQIFLANAVLADELIVYVHPEEAQEVIERNEMQFEEIRWYSFPDHIRIAKIRTELLLQPDAEFSITLFDDVPPISVKSNGLTGRKWTGVKTQGGIPEEALKSSLESQGASGIIDPLIRKFNTVELWVQTYFRDRRPDESIAYQGQFIGVPDGQDAESALSNVPVFVEEQVKEISGVYGHIYVFDPVSGTSPLRAFTIKRPDNDSEYVMIYEFDNSKNDHLTDAPHDPVAWAQSELGQKYARLREEKEAYLAGVAKRIAERNKKRGD